MASFAWQHEIDRQAVSLYGFGLYSVWVFYSLHGTLIEKTLSPAMPSMFFSFFSPLTIAACLVLVGIFHCQFQRIIKQPVFIILCTVVALVGSLIMVSTPRDILLRHIATLITHVLFDIIMLVWLKVFSDFELEIIVKKLPGILTIAGLGIWVLVVLPNFARAVVFSLLPFGQLATVLYAQKTSSAAPLSTEGAKSSVLIKTLVGSALFCTASGILLSLTRFSEVEPELTVSFYNFFLTETGAALLVISICAFVQSFVNRHAFPASFSVMPSVAIVLCTGVFIFATTGPWQRMMLTSMGLSAYNLIFIVAFLVVTRHYQCSALQLFAFGRAVYSIASAFSNLIVVLLMSASGRDASYLEVAVLVFACQIVVVIGFLVFILNRDDARAARIMLEEGVEAALISGGCISEKEFSAQFASVCSGAANSAGCVGAGYDNASIADSQDKSADVDTSTFEPQHPSVISQMADIYKLSERETEVLAQLVKGRSIKRTGEELYISVGTVNTYLRRIYQKMDIHSRQELIDRFDELRQKQQ